MLLHLERTHKGLRILFDNLDHFALGIVALALGIDQHPHPVAVHGVHRVALGNENRLFVVGNDMILTVRTTFETAYHLGAPAVGLVFAGRDLDQEVLLSHALEQLEHHLFLGRSLGPNPMSDLFVIKRPLSVLIEELDHQGQHIFLFDSLGIFFLRLFHLIGV